jgi:hypothetical protein
MDCLFARDRRDASCDTDRDCDLTTMCSDYTPDAKQIKGKTAPSQAQTRMSRLLQGLLPGVAAEHLKAQNCGVGAFII